MTLLSLFATRAQAATRYVSTSGSDAGGCESSATACASVSYALDQAGSGDTIDIGVGAFEELDGLLIDKPITLRGVGTGSPDVTVLRAHRFPDQAKNRVITIEGDIEVTISSLIIRHGVANNLLVDPYGGGISNHGGTLTLTGVVFSGNQAGAGGGMFNSGADSSCVLENVTFDSNEAYFGGGMYSQEGSACMLTNVLFENNDADTGGGLFVNPSGSVTLISTVFIENTAILYGGGIYNGSHTLGLDNVSLIANQAGVLGGGIYNAYASPVMSGVQFYANTSQDSGGGMHTTQGSPLLTNVSFTNNTAPNSGGGIDSNESSLTLVNATFSGNTAGEGGGLLSKLGSTLIINAEFSHNSALTGGGLGNLSSSPTLINVSLGENTAEFRGGGLYNFDSNTATLKNSVVWGNTAGFEGNEIYNTSMDDDMHVTLSYSLVSDDSNDVVNSEQGGGSISTAYINVLNNNPLFQDSANGNLRLMPNSPAIDSGDPGTDLSVFPGGPDHPLDLDSNLRLYNGRIDIGAYEWLPIDLIFQSRFETP